MIIVAKVALFIIISKEICSATLQICIFTPKVTKKYSPHHRGALAERYGTSLGQSYNKICLLCMPLRGIYAKYRRF